MITLLSEKEVAEEVARRFRALRLQENMSQRTLAERSGVSLGTLKHFERTAQVSLKNLLLLSSILGRSGEFLKLYEPNKEAETLQEIEERLKRRKRGRQ
jgi:transcriptional regulator with XRE-family HTH domain